MLIRGVHQGRTKPPYGARIDWSHPMARGLVCCLLFDEPGGKPIDLATGIAATPTNGPTKRVHLYGPEFKFVAASDQYIALGDPARLQITGAITIAAEYRLDSTPALNNAFQIAAKDKDTGGRAYNLDVNLAAVNSGARFYINGGGAGGSADLVGEGRNPVTGDDRQVIGTYRSGDRQLGLYVNGGLVASKIASAASIPSATANVLVGRREYAGFTNPFDGSIRYVLIWNRFMPAQEARQLYDPRTRWAFLTPARARTTGAPAAPVGGGARSQVVVVG